MASMHNLRVVAMHSLSSFDSVGFGDSGAAEVITTSGP
jgi:hypothetical protein